MWRSKPAAIRRVADSRSVPGEASIQWTSIRSPRTSTDNVPGVSVMLLASKSRPRRDFSPVRTSTTAGRMGNDGDKTRLATSRLARTRA